MTPAYPLSGIVGQDDLKLALLLNAIDPAIGGVLVRGQKGTAKSTAVRALAALLPAVEVVAGCPFSCDPTDPAGGCPAGPHDGTPLQRRPARLVELPVGASEDRVAGAIDLERALAEGARAFHPGLLAAAHRGVLYVDEVNLLPDHLVDLLLDAAAMGTNHVEREGISFRHPARFLLVGTMNPEEGELRPQLLDRFGLTVEVAAPDDHLLRAEVVRRRLAYDADPAVFAARFAGDDSRVADRVAAARTLLPRVRLADAMLDRVVAVCAAFAVDGLRADITTARAARALAAWEDRAEVAVDDVRRAALLALPHRRRRQPFEDPGIDEDALDRALDGDRPDPPDGGPGGGGARGSGGDGHAGGSEAAEEAPAPAGAGAGPQRPDGEGAGGGAAEEVFAPGEGFRPALLTVPGAGEGVAGRRSPARGGRGAAVGARPARQVGRGGVAVAATVRAAAPHQHVRGRTPGGPLRLRADDLHTTVREGREGNLVVFVVDTSGSMGARRRMVAVKGAVRALLLDAYQRRDRVALVTFRADRAEVVLPPTSSVELADRRLAAVPTGGRTPLAAGLAKAADLVAAEAVRDPRRRPLVVVLTDGRANAGGSDPRGEARRAARALAERGRAAVVVDTEEGAVRLGLAADVARHLAAPCLRLEDLAAAPLVTAVRSRRVA